MSGDSWSLLFLVIALGGLMWWTLHVYEPRMKAKAAAEARLFECIMARELVEMSSSNEHRDRMLSCILSRRPTMPSWPEWHEVWGEDDPFKPERTLH